MDYEDLLHYDYTTMSLREHLIPLSTFLKHVVELESFGKFQVRMKKLMDIAESDHMMVVPYGYRSPAWKDIFKETYQITDETTLHHAAMSCHDKDIIALWGSTVEHRVSRYLRNIVSEDDVAFIDHNSDVRVIISAATGAIYPFSRFALSRFDVVTIPITVPSFILNHYPDKFNGSFKEFKEMQFIAHKYAVEKKCNVWIAMCAGRDIQWIEVTAISSLDANTVQALVDYLQCGLDAGLKVLTIV